MGSNNQNTRDFSTVIISNGFDNVITEPTRISTESSSVLDLFITNSQLRAAISGVISYDISDHLPVFLCVNGSRLQTNNNEEIYYRMITDAALARFREEVLNVDDK